MQHAGCGFGYPCMQQLVVFIICIEEGVGRVDPDTEMVLCCPIFPVPGEAAAVEAMPGIGMDFHVDGGVGGAGDGEFGHRGACEIFGKVCQGEVIAMIYDDRGHLPMKDQETAVAFYPEVADVIE